MVVWDRPGSPGAELGDIRAVSMRNPVGQAAFGGGVGQNQGVSTTPARSRRPSTAVPARSSI